MATVSLELSGVFALTSLAGLVMFVKGLSVNMLERRIVRCRVCGGIVHRTCTCSRR